MNKRTFLVTIDNQSFRIETFNNTYPIFLSEKYLYVTNENAEIKECQNMEEYNDINLDGMKSDDPDYWQKCFKIFKMDKI